MKPYVIVDNTIGVIGLMFDEKQALEYIKFLAYKFGEKMPDDPETYRFVWEDLYSYSKEFLLTQINNGKVSG